MPSPNASIRFVNSVSTISAPILVKKAIRNKLFNASHPKVRVILVIAAKSVSTFLYVNRWYLGGNSGIASREKINSG